ncbi:MAG: DUF2332 family protein, partial [Pseudomonadota bacterium]
PRGAALPVASGARVAVRQGFDVSPLDVGRETDRAWLVACVWPGETARLNRLQAAIDAFRALAGDAAPPRLAMSDLADVPERLNALAQGTGAPALHLAYQTVVRDYLTDATRARYVEGMRRWVAAAEPQSPRIWVELEAPPGATSMAIEAHVASGTGAVLDLTLAWCGFHPDRVTPEADAVRAFTAATSAR